MHTHVPPCAKSREVAHTSRIIGIPRREQRAWVVTKGKAPSAEERVAESLRELMGTKTRKQE